MAENDAGGLSVYHCTFESLMPDMSLIGVIRGKPVRTTQNDRAALIPIEHVNRQMLAIHDHAPIHLGGLVHRRDRGGHYVSIKFTQNLADSGVKGIGVRLLDSYHNVIAAAIIGLYKADIIVKFRPWCSLEAVEFEMLEQVNYFSRVVCRNPSETSNR